ncbi:MAG: hypothetical protein ACXVA6_21400 [Isosphaeraceae bacterium]
MPWQIVLLIIGTGATLAALGVRISIPGMTLDLKEQLSRKSRALIGVIGACIAAYGGLEIADLAPVPRNGEASGQVVVKLPIHYREASGDDCFSDAPGSNLVLGDGPPVFEDLVQCRYSPGSTKTHTYEFDLPSLPAGAKVEKFTGMFGIDESGNAKHPAAQAAWTVHQANQQPCDVYAQWGKPGECHIDSPVSIVPNEPLIIDERLYCQVVQTRNPSFWG